MTLVTLAEQRHKQKETEIKKNKVRIIAPGGGRKPEMSPKEGVCLCLVYLRQKPTFDILGLLFYLIYQKLKLMMHLTIG